MAAHQFYVECRDDLLEVGYVADALGCTIALTDICVTQGRLREAARHFAQGLARGQAGSGPPLRGTADMHVGLSELAVERNDLAAAWEHLRACEELGEYAGLPQNRYRQRVARACVCLAEGDADGALELLDAAERVYMGDLSPNVRLIAALRARVWAGQGRLTDALAWVRTRGLAARDELSYVGEYEYVTLARLMMAEYRQRGRRARCAKP